MQHCKRWMCLTVDIPCYVSCQPADRQRLLDLVSWQSGSNVLRKTGPSHHVSLLTPLGLESKRQIAMAAMTWMYILG